MSGRYFSTPNKPHKADDGWWSTDIPRPSSIDVPDHVATNTGLLDVRGNPIMRAPRPIGFLWDWDEV